MASTRGHGAARRVGILAASSALCWAGFVALGSSAYAANDTSHGNGGNSASAHSNGHGHDDGTTSTPGSSDPGSSDHSGGTSGTSGDPTQPQPPSNADQNGGGANGQCPGGAYCSTRDGSPSGNGNGNGNATGKPCAGCVGKADNKNPQGQRPNGSDHNAGYECDRNHGIGRSNPAHTGCTTSSSTPPPVCSGGSMTSSSGDCNPPPSCASTSANDCDGPPVTNPPVTNPPVTNPPAEKGCPGGEMVDGACVSGVSFKRPSAVVQSSAAARPATVLGTSMSRSSLPFTGAPVGLLVELGITTLLIGTTLTVVTRRRRQV